MAQVTLYLPEALAKLARRRARGAGKSLSAYVAELLAREASPRTWPKDFIDLLEHGRADLAEPDDPPPEDRAPLG